MVDKNGSPLLKHFTPFKTPNSAGVNIFAQDSATENNLHVHVFAPFCLIFPVLRFLMEQKVKKCTFVFPSFTPKPSWWPLLWRFSEKHIVLGYKGNMNVILGPSKCGYVPKKLPHDLFVSKLVF